MNSSNEAVFQLDKSLYKVHTTEPGPLTELNHTISVNEYPGISFASGGKK